MDIIKITNYTKLPNLTIFLLSLLQPESNVALPKLRGNTKYKYLLPYLTQGDIKVKFYNKNQFKDLPPEIFSVDVFLLPWNWNEIFLSLNKVQPESKQIVLIPCNKLEERTSALVEFIQIQIYNNLLECYNSFLVSKNATLLHKLQRMSSYSMLDIPILSKNI